MPTLYLKCKTCKMEFPSGIAMDTHCIATAQLSNIGHNCPKGHMNIYDKKDYYFKQ